MFFDSLHSSGSPMGLPRLDDHMPITTRPAKIGPAFRADGMVRNGNETSSERAGMGSARRPKANTRRDGKKRVRSGCMPQNCRDSRGLSTQAEETLRSSAARFRPHLRLRRFARRRLSEWGCAAAQPYHAGADVRLRPAIELVTTARAILDPEWHALRAEHGTRAGGVLSRCTPNNRLRRVV